MVGKTKNRNSFSYDKTKTWLKANKYFVKMVLIFQNECYLLVTNK